MPTPAPPGGGKSVPPLSKADSYDDHFIDQATVNTSTVSAHRDLLPLEIARSDGSVPTRPVQRRASFRGSYVNDFMVTQSHFINDPEAPHHRQDSSDIKHTATTKPFHPKHLARAYFGNFWAQMCILMLTVAACCFFIIETYMEDSGVDSAGITVLEVLLALFFLFDYFMSVAYSLDPMAYIFSFHGMVDLISVLPGLLFFFHGIGCFPTHTRATQAVEALTLIRVLRGLKVFRVMKLSDYSGDHFNQSPISEQFGLDEVSTQAFKVILWLLGSIYITASMVWFVSKHWPGSFSGDDMQFHDCCYYVAVTLSTVGYGDIYPSSAFARIMIFVFVFFFLTAFPFQLGKLMNLVTSRNPYASGRFRPLMDTEHVVVCGKLGQQALQRFIVEFLHGAQASNHRLRLVFLSPEKPGHSVSALLQQPLYRDRLKYLCGSPWDATDLRRAAAGQASMVYVVADFNTNDVTADQDRIVLTAVSVRKYLMHQYDTSTTNSESLRDGDGGDLASQTRREVEAWEQELDISERIVIKTHTIAGVEQLNRMAFSKVYCSHLIRLRVMAYAALFPGIMSFLVMLLRGEAALQDEAGESEWYKTLAASCKHRVVRVAIDLQYQRGLEGSSFTEVASCLYKLRSVIMVGVEIQGVFIMNPGKQFYFRSDGHQGNRSVFVYCISVLVDDVRTAFQEVNQLLAARRTMEAETGVIAGGGASVKRFLANKDLPPPRLEELAKRAVSTASKKSGSPKSSASQQQRDLVQLQRILSEAQKEQTEVGKPLATIRSSDWGEGSGAAQDEQGLNGKLSPPGSPRKGFSPKATFKWIEGSNPAGQGILQKLHHAKDALERMIDSSSQNVSLGHRQGHIVVGLSAQDSFSDEGVVELLCTIRYLVPLPVVVLGEDPKRFRAIISGLKAKVVSGDAHHWMDHENDQSTTPTELYGISFVKGSPMRKQDLQRCHVRKAYAVILLGDREEEGSADTDTISSDRKVLLAAFQLEGILRRDLYGEVMTLVDLKNESNMYLLRQTINVTTKPPLTPTKKTPSPRVTRHSSSMPNPPIQRRRSLMETPDTNTIGINKEAPIGVLNSTGRLAASIGWNTIRGVLSGTGLQQLTGASRMQEKAVTLEQMSPIFAAGRVSAHSFFNLIALYFHQNPTARQFFFELTRSDEQGIIQSRYMEGDVDSEDDEGYQSSSSDSEKEKDPQNSSEARWVEDHYAQEDAMPEMFAAHTTLGQSPRTLRQMVNDMRSVLDQIRVPIPLVGCRYSALVNALIEHDIMPIGLYRPAGVGGAPLPYTVINPDRETKLTSNDKVFILRPRSQIPN